MGLKKCRSSISVGKIRQMDSKQNMMILRNIWVRYIPLSLRSKTRWRATTPGSYFDLLLSIGRYGQLSTSLYDKHNDFNFRITNFPFLCSNIPSSPVYAVFISHLIRYARDCSSYECFFLRAARLSFKLRGQGYVRDRLKIVSQEVLWSIWGSYQTL